MVSSRVVHCLPPVCLSNCLKIHLHSIYHSYFPLHTGINPQMETKAYFALRVFSTREKPRSKKHANTIKETQNGGFWWTKSKHWTLRPPLESPGKSPSSTQMPSACPKFPVGGALYQGTLPCLLRTPNFGNS